MTLTRLYKRTKTLILAHSGNSFAYSQTFHIYGKAQAARCEIFYTQKNQITNAKL